MKYDIFFSICQTEVDGHMPSERVMFENFFSQIRLADQLGFGTAWVAETHLSCEIQKSTAQPVIPHFKGEIGLNTDILQMAHVIFAQTKTISVGSAIRNILCNGGPVAHAEAVRTFLTLHDLKPNEDRLLELGFAAGRFEFSNRPYGILPRNEFEQAAWPVLKGKILIAAAEIFLRLLKGEKISSTDVAPMTMERSDFRSDQDWLKAQTAAGERLERYTVPAFWNFEKLGVIPFDASLKNLRLTLGSHDEKAQRLANSILPVGVFNLSITPPQVIEQTHLRMRECYHASGGTWQRSLMPRTAMVFLNNEKGWSNEARTAAAKEMAAKAWSNYWKAMEGTLDQKKVDEAVANTLAGSPEDLARAIAEKYHPEDRLMLWFDFNCHDNAFLHRSMRSFMEDVVPRIEAH